MLCCQDVAGDLAAVGFPSHLHPRCPCHHRPPCLQAAYPAAWVRQAKFWPTTSRVDNVYGDRHLVLRLPETAAAGEEAPQAATA